MSIVLCNRDNCKHNANQQCTCEQIGIVDLMCVTRRRANVNRTTER